MRRKVREMYELVTETLKQRSQAIRADAIIWLSVNIDEISGKVILCLSSGHEV